MRGELASDAAHELDELLTLILVPGVRGRRLLIGGLASGQPQEDILQVSEVASRQDILRPEDAEWRQHVVDRVSGNTLRQRYFIAGEDFLDGLAHVVRHVAQVGHHIRAGIGHL